MLVDRIAESFKTHVQCNFIYSRNKHKVTVLLKYIQKSVPFCYKLTFLGLRASTVCL